ncbi:unnamed protein product [marine sediment metagenome]|uniref:Uncharacterized protein n=1 Tax=marine sediment metagenome TaxID=412755 RepID=X1NPP0_9ZZZZ
MAWYKKSEDIKGDRWMFKYDRGLEKMKDLLGIDIDNTLSMIPESSLSHFNRRARWPEY